MSKAKHTPGPWKSESSANPDGSDLIVITDGLLIADLRDTDCGVESVEEAKANARLIASAPELLKTLKLIADFGEADGSPFALSAAETARHAIAKAEGRQS